MTVTIAMASQAPVQLHRNAVHAGSLLSDAPGL